MVPRHADVPFVLSNDRYVATFEHIDLYYAGTGEWLIVYTREKFQIGNAQSITHKLRDKGYSEIVLNALRATMAIEESMK